MPAQMKPLRYLDHNACPSDKPAGHPHIIDASDFDEETDKGDLCFADGIATFLWNWDKEQFARFFDLTRDKFEIHYGAPDGLIKDMIIARTGRGVLAGFRRRDPDYGDMEWDPQLLFEIGTDGKWVGQYCSEASTPWAIEGYGRSFAEAILYNVLGSVRSPTTKITVYHD